MKRMVSESHALALREIMRSLPTCSAMDGAQVRLMIDGLSPSACVPARVLRLAGRGVMLDFARGWADLRVEDDGFMIQVGFQGGTMDVGAGWDAVAYAENAGKPLLRAEGSPPACRGLLERDGNVLRANFQQWSRA